MPQKTAHVLSDSAYDYLQEQIFTQKLRCGDKIYEQDVVNCLNISRTPVREAIRRLASEGILNFYPNRFAEVISFSSQTILDLGRVRIVTDSLAAQLAIWNGSNRDFQELANIAEQCKQANDKHDMYHRILYDCEFHMKLVEISENQILIDIHKGLILKTRLLQTTMLEDSTSTLCNINDHATIIKALIDRNVDSALKAIQEHLYPFYGIDFNIRVPMLGLHLQS